jgi:hypothetical protein
MTEKLDADHHGSFEDTSLGIGQNADGTFNSFPLSELPQQVAKTKSEQEATSYAIEQSESGYPGEEDDDLSDLDDLDDILAEKA